MIFIDLKDEIEFRDILLGLITAGLPSPAHRDKDHGIEMEIVHPDGIGLTQACYYDGQEVGVLISHPNGMISWEQFVASAEQVMRKLEQGDSVRVKYPLGYMLEWKHLPK
jgi:hypothetical protein